MSKHFKAIAAMARNRVIGNANKLPWHLPEELKWFKRRTIGQVLIMGRKTFESIGRPLPNRETIVLSRTGWTFPGIKVVGSLDEIDPATDAREYFIVGGAQIYEQALPLCSDLYLTVVHREVDGDAFFPEFEKHFPNFEVVMGHPEFEIRHYKNSGCM